MSHKEIAAAREAAIDRVELPLDKSEKSEGVRAIFEVAKGCREFTTFDVRRVAGFDPAEPRAWGAIMRIAHRAGICSPTDRYRSGRSLTSHGRPERVWSSLVFLESDSLFSVVGGAA